MENKTTAKKPANFIASAFRWVLYVILLFAVIYTIGLAFEWLVVKALSLSIFWLIVVALLFSPIVIGLFASLTSLLTSTLMLVAPNLRTAGVMFGLLAGIEGVGEVFMYSAYDISLFAKIIILIEVVVVWGSLTTLGFSIKEVIEE